jgi:hypothetical protein
VKKLIIIQNSVFIFLVSNIAHAQSSGKIVSGFKGLQQVVTQIAMVLGPLSFIAAGVIYFKNKQEGHERLSGSVIGTIVIGASSMIFSMIYNLFN